MNKTATQQEEALYTTAHNLIQNGVSIVPIDRNTKQPLFSVLPRDENGKAQWEPFKKRIATANEVDLWLDREAQIAVVAGKVSGGVETLDFDQPGFFEDWCACLPELYEHLPLQRTGGGGWQLTYRTDKPLGNTKLAWAKDDTLPDGRTIAIETRGEGGYFVIAPSIHPTGNKYQMITGDYANIPYIPESTQDLFFMAARDLCQAPRGRREVEKMQRATPVRDNAALNGERGVIEAFNEQYTIESILEQFNYTKRGARYAAPGASNKVAPSVSILDGNASFHWDSNDPLSDTHSHTPFDVWCFYRHNDKIKEAVKEAAQMTGLAHTDEQRKEYGRRKYAEKLVALNTPQAPQAAPTEQVAQPTQAPSDTAKTLTRSQVIMQALAELGYSFKLNLCNDVVEVNGKPIDDITAARIRTEMRDRDVRPISAVEDAYITDASRNAYHPVRDYLNGLKWDGVRRIATLASMLESNDPDVVYKDGRRVPLAELYLSRWLRGAVARALHGHQNMMLVLDGLQDIGKSYFTAWMCSELSKYFIEERINPDDKDCTVRLMNKFIWEVGELDATTRKADVAALKAFITKQQITVRKAYGRHDIEKPAICSLVGTVNNSTGFLADETGSRRFWVIKVERFNRDYTNLPVGQIWAEAVHDYKNGEPFCLVDEEVTARDQQNKNYQLETPLTSWIEKYFIIDAGDTSFMTPGDILDVLRVQGITLNGSGHSQMMELSRVLATFAPTVTATRSRGQRGYSGIAKR